jgi:hypothetical protein
MAAGAGDFAFAVRHVRRALQLGAAHLVALQAELRLGLLYTTVLGEGRVIAAVGGQGYLYFLLYLMAIHASYAAGLVGAALPKKMCAARMAIQANGILLSDGVCRVLAEANGDGILPAPSFHVRPAGTVAGFATPGFVRRPRIRYDKLRIRRCPHSRRRHPGRRRAWPFPRQAQAWLHHRGSDRRWPGQSRPAKCPAQAASGGGPWGCLRCA